MTGKLKDYQVLDVFCAGTFYKVRHKVTNHIFAWKAYNCSAYTDEQIKKIVEDVKTVSAVASPTLLRYYDTILHSPSKTLYFVLEYNSWRSLQESVNECKNNDKHIAESFIWYMLRELAQACKAVEHLELDVVKIRITPSSVFVGERGELRINCFDLPVTDTLNMMRQVGQLIREVCYRCDNSDILEDFHYSDDLRDVVTFLTDDKNYNLHPDVILYHPTILSNLETVSVPTHLGEIAALAQYTPRTSEVNKCDSEKAVELCRTVEPLPRTHKNLIDSPIYSNIVPRSSNKNIEQTDSCKGSLSPTLAALALELPGFVPRSRKPYNAVLGNYNCPQQVSEDTLSHQWMSRLIALRQREHSLNKRERDIIAKEILNSPTTKVIPLNNSEELLDEHSNGITLPPVITQGNDGPWASRRRHRRSVSIRSKGRRKSYAYEDLDSSLSADTGDSSMIVTAKKLTKENMPRRNIFPDNSSKKVHFTPSNPFAESDESVTLTFYELENVDHEGYQIPKYRKDLTKFKYLNTDKIDTEKRAAVWSHSSPSKQAKVNMLTDVTNKGNLRKTPSKSSLTSKGSNISRYSCLSSTKSQWSIDSKVSDGNISDRTRSSIRHSILNTPIAPDMQRSKRKSLLAFKTPFKFMSSNKH